MQPGLIEQVFMMQLQGQDLNRVRMFGRFPEINYLSAASKDPREYLVVDIRVHMEDEKVQPLLFG
jgi:hypothetical protein